MVAMNSCTQAANRFISLNTNAKHEDTGHLHLVGSQVLYLHILPGSETVKRHVSLVFQRNVQTAIAIAITTMKATGKDSSLPAGQGHIYRNR